MVYPTEWKTEFIAKNGKKVVFRPEQSSDTEMLWEMFSTLSEKSASNLLPPFTRERIESWTRNIDYDEVLAIVAVIETENGQRIIGSASLKFNSQEPLKHKAEFGITVQDDCQNKGIGTELLAHLVNIARTKNLTKLHLNVNATNDRAISLYKKAGFRIEGTLVNESYVNGKYRDEHRMALFL